MGEGILGKHEAGIDFKKPPTRIDDFKVGDTLTRENFITFLIMSFAVSRGQAHVHVAFLDWMKQKSGFDYLGVIKSFCEAGAWGNLSYTERQMFLNAHKSTKQHETKDPTPEYLSAAVGALYKDLIEGWKKFGGELMEQVHFEKIHTLAEFNVVISKYLAGRNSSK